MPRISIRLAKTPNPAKNPNINPRAWLPSLGMILLVASGLLASGPAAWSQPSLEWTWMGGSDKEGQPGVYGKLGVPAAGNSPGSRDSAASWTDGTGQFWLFGGLGDAGGGYTGYLNDLWKFDTKTSLWTWMGGSSKSTCIEGNFCGNPGVYGTLGTPAPGNIPGGRSDAATWTDSNGHFWLFGGYGFDAAGKNGLLNDLWEFNTATNEWSWMGGSNHINQYGVYGKLGKPAPDNIPGSRSGASSWTDNSGHLWLFGGLGQGQDPTDGLLNDLWEFNPTTSEWSWMGGTSILTCKTDICGQPGVYGILGTAAPGNTPGGRYYASAWTDNSGHFWFFGGLGYDADGNEDALNDLWEFNPTTNEWTWVGGSSALLCDDFCPAAGVYGVFQTFNAGNIPSGRQGAQSWTDSAGNFWLYGGDNSDNIGDQLEDLWQFNPVKNEWAWMGGSSALEQPGVYGVLGLAAPGNLPGGRSNGSGWTDNKGHLWLFGGFEYSSTGVADYYNDLWRLQLPATGALKATTTTLTSSQVSSPYFAPVTFSVKVVSGTATPPNGDFVTILDGTNILGTATLTSGKGTFTTAALLIGSYSISAGFAGDATYAQSTSTTLTQTVTKAASAVKLAASPNPSILGNPVTFTATVTVPGILSPTGTVTFKNGSTVLGTTALNPDLALATISNSSLPIGTYSLTAQYSGDTNFTSGTSNTLTQVVTSTQNVWVWMDGNEYVDYYGVYGILGTASQENIPGARDGSADWTDASGHLWLFGGKGYDSLGNKGELSDLWEYNPQSDEWTWIGGGSAAGKPGVYGQTGVTAAANVPGARTSPVSWKDASGNMWLLGGVGVDANGVTGSLNDLWKFNPATSEWTWMGGNSTVGAKGGQPGVYGKLTVAAAGNAPGSRDSAASWTDSIGHFWLFGGIGFDANGNQGELNDLWEYNPTTNLWAWIAGNSTLNTSGGRFGIYGRLGTPAATNAPGGRHSSSTWTDSKGNLWLFGGGGFGASGDGGTLDDLWEFNTTTRQWTWMGGPQTAGPTDRQPGVYGTIGVAAASNFPGGRYAAASWSDKTGNLWLLGGNGFDAAGTVGILNDLWEFNLSTNQWTWAGGSSTVGSNGVQPSVYGAPGLPAAGNLPGSRFSSATWTDPSGNLWLLGGIGVDIQGKVDLLNDLWRYTP